MEERTYEAGATSVSLTFKSWIMYDGISQKKYTMFIKELLVFHCSVVEDSILLGYDTMSDSNHFLTFDTLFYNYK